jgi:hypothetical protein
MNGQLTTVISIDRRNTLVKSISWRLEVWRFSRPLIQLSCNCVQAVLVNRREIHTLREVLLRVNAQLSSRSSRDAALPAFSGTAPKPLARC